MYLLYYLPNDYCDSKELENIVHFIRLVCNFTPVLIFIISKTTIGPQLDSLNLIDEITELNSARWETQRGLTPLFAYG